MSGKTKAIIVLIALLIVGCFIMAQIMANIKASHEEQFANLIISDINLSDIADGSYMGKYEIFPVLVEVRVIVREHRITEIELVEHNNYRGGPAEVIPSKVIEAQNLDVDVISGATASSKVILKAIEAALSPEP